MVVVPAGSFMMGSSPPEIAALEKETKNDRYESEGPQRKVTIARPFAVGKYEVTFAEWDACMGAGGCKHNPGDEGWGRGKRPVINVSWDDVTKEYLPWLSRKTGKTYRLLTEAEWEYTARAGTTTRYYFGDDEKELCSYDNVADQTAKEHFKALTIASCRDGYYRTAPVGSFHPNAFGLYDMHGNVKEWVEDCWDRKRNYVGAPTDGSAWTTSCFEERSRMLRGGSFYSMPQDARSAIRVPFPPVNRSFINGFRLARTLD